jgi:hypothetical protein
VRGVHNSCVPPGETASSQGWLVQHLTCPRLYLSLHNRILQTTTCQSTCLLQNDGVVRLSPANMSVCAAMAAEAGGSLFEDVRLQVQRHQSQPEQDGILVVGADGGGPGVTAQSQKSFADLARLVEKAILDKVRAVRSMRRSTHKSPDAIECCGDQGYACSLPSGITAAGAVQHPPESARPAVRTRVPAVPEAQLWCEWAAQGDRHNVGATC